MQVDSIIFLQYLWLVHAQKNTPRKIHKEKMDLYIKIISSKGYLYFLANLDSFYL